MSCNCNNGVYNPFCHEHRPCPTSTAPAPQPPWARPIQSPVEQTLNGGGNIDLSTDATYLRQSTPNPAANNPPYPIVIPNGNYLRQQKRIMIVKDANGVSAPFTLTGTFDTFVSLAFTPIGTNATLEWNGVAWTMLAGNAEPLP